VVARLGAGKNGVVEKGCSLCDPEQRLVAIKTTASLAKTEKEIAAHKVRMWLEGDRERGVIIRDGRRRRSLPSWAAFRGWWGICKGLKGSQG